MEPVRAWLHADRRQATAIVIAIDSAALRCTLHCSTHDSVDVNIGQTQSDAGQNPTLARPAAPLAACVQRHPCISTKIGCYGKVL